MKKLRNTETELKKSIAYKKQACNHILFFFSENTVSGIFSHRLWYHSEHAQHCAIS